MTAQGKGATPGGVTRYRTIVADPPWPVKDTGKRTAPINGNWARGTGTTGKPSVVPYNRMDVEEIKQLPVEEMARADAHLYLWTVNAYLPEAYEVAWAWGFKPSQLLTWCKKPMGLGFGGTYVPTTEFILFCRRGSLPAKRRIDSTWFEWRRGASHSAKPDAFLDMVEQTSPSPHLEMFARRGRIGWDYWGDQSLGTAQLPGEAA